MSEFSFLTESQVVGDNNLDVIKKYGTKCAVTDFAALLGCSNTGAMSAYYVEDSSSIKLRTGNWWLKKENKKIYIVGRNGEKTIGYEFKRTIGIRPILPYEIIKNISSNKKINLKGFLELECGEYPQTVVLRNLSEELENLYVNNKIKKTGNSYTTDLIDYKEINIPFKERTHIEYEYNNKKYIRFENNLDNTEITLSDCHFVRKGSVYWIEVEPIEWIIDMKTDIAVSKKIICSGIQYNRRNNCVCEFEKSAIKEFMDKYLYADVFSEEMKRKNKNERDRRNPYGFNFDKVSEEDIIKGAIESGVAVFLHGKSSEGKSARVKQIDPECVIIYLRNATPESLNGKSVYNSETGEMIDVKPTWLKKLEERCLKEPDKNHIVFLDEITNALPSIQGIAFNIVLDREVNGIWQLPENARIVAAGNDMKDSLAANELAEPLFNRFAHVYIETTVESWLEWASKNNIHPAIYAYIAYKKDKALRSEYNGERPNADPRKWEMASKMLYKTGRPEMLRALVGEDITREFVGFCNQRVITLEDVLKNNYTKEEIEQLNVSERYATVYALTGVDEENFEKVREFIKLLGQELCTLFENIWGNSEERLEIIAEKRLVMKR